MSAYYHVIMYILVKVLCTGYARKLKLCFFNDKKLIPLVNKQQIQMENLLSKAYKFILISFLKYIEYKLKKFLYISM